MSFGTQIVLAVSALADASVQSKVPADLRHLLVGRVRVHAD